MSSDSSNGPNPVQRKRSSGSSKVFFSRFIYLLFCFEVGLVLLLLPWTLLWDNNYFFSLQPQYSEFWLSNHLRGAISGVGIVNLWMGISEITKILVGKSSRSLSH